MTTGVGSVCAKKDVKLMALAIPANYGQAMIFAMAMHDEMLAPETVEVWHKAYKSLLKCAEKAANASTDMTVMTQTGNDLREVIRACDFLCSFEHPRALGGGTYINVKNSMVQIIRALGYVGLAGVISGQASTSASKIWFEKGRVFMTGLGNTSGWQTMKKIPGIVTPRFRGDRAPYTAPACSAVAFLAAVQAHWPMYEGDVASITAEASTWLQTQPAPVSFTVNANGTLANTSGPGQSPGASGVQAKPGSGAVITLRSEDVVLKFNWVNSANMYGFMAALKGVCAPKERGYSPATKEWSFLLCHLDRLVEVIEKTEIYGKPRVVVPEKDLGQARAVTPIGLYGASKPAYRGKSRPWGGRGRADYLSR